jgi:hypothetical protein
MFFNPTFLKSFQTQAKTLTWQNGYWGSGGLKSGLPDYFWCNIPKREKYTK